MGFRSVFVSEHTGLKWPSWFVYKWVGKIHFPPLGSGPISSIFEGKTYGVFAELPADVQQCISDQDAERKVESVSIVFMHECGGITKVRICKDSIDWAEPSGWRKSDGVEHWYCMGCSDPRKAEEPANGG